MVSGEVLPPGDCIQPDRRTVRLIARLAQHGLGGALSPHHKVSSQANDPARKYSEGVASRSRRRGTRLAPLTTGVTVL